MGISIKAFIWYSINLQLHNLTGWERTGQILCIVDTSLSVLMTLRMCLRELCCLFTVWILTTW